jgi:prephenate dehydrogenase
MSPRPAALSSSRADSLADKLAFRRIAVIGVGLIGGSLARALKRAGCRAEFVGYGRNHLGLQRAVELGVIDRFETTVALAVEGADMVVIAVPVGTIGAMLSEVALHLDPEAVVTDVGSTKQNVIAQARATLGAGLPAFVPGHPIAGTERRGVEASSATLFEGHSVLLTPLPETRPLAMARVRAMWEATGASVTEMDAARHDRILAATSHLPHMLAYTLVDTLAGLGDGEDIFNYAAGGFRDFSRIASSDPAMWRDICLANGPAIVAALERYRGNLDALVEAIRRGDGGALMELFGRAKAVRDRAVKPRP